MAPRLQSHVTSEECFIRQFHRGENIMKRICPMMTVTSLHSIILWDYCVLCDPSLTKPSFWSIWLYFDFHGHKVSAKQLGIFYPVADVSWWDFSRPFDHSVRVTYPGTITSLRKQRLKLLTMETMLRRRAEILWAVEDGGLPSMFASSIAVPSPLLLKELPLNYLPSLQACLPQWIPNLKPVKKWDYIRIPPHHD